MKKTLLKDYHNRHLNVPAFVCGHGPSLDIAKNRNLFPNDETSYIRFGCNRWYDFFTTEPDYWVLCNNVLTVQTEFQRIENSSSKMKALFFAKTVDLNGENEAMNLSKSWCSYDDRHFKHHTCQQILSNANQSSTEYGNNSLQFDTNRLLYGNSGFDPNGRCCFNISHEQKTIQETLQELTEYSQHYSTGDTVALHMLALAVIMGCNPINVVGVDLNYELGYAEGSSVAAPKQDSWEWKVYGPCIQNDFEIIRKSANAKQIQINFVK